MATFSVDITSVQFSAINTGYKDITITGMPQAGVSCSITGTDSSSFGYRLEGSDPNVYRVYTTTHTSIGTSAAAKTATFKITNLGDSSDYVEVSLEQIAYYGYATVVSVSTSYGSIYPYYEGIAFGSFKGFFEYTGATGSNCEVLVDGYESTTSSDIWITYTASTTYTDAGFKRVLVSCTNNYDAARRGTIKFSSGGNNCFIYQNGYPSSTSGCTSPISFTASGGTERVTLNHTNQNVANLGAVMYMDSFNNPSYTKTGNGNYQTYWDITVGANAGADAIKGVIYYQRTSTSAFLGFTIVNQDGQSGPAPTLIADPALLTYPSTGGAKVLDVVYAAPLTTNESSMPSWLSSTYVQVSSGERSYTITAANNDTTLSRDWNFEFTDANSFLSVPIQQEAGQAASLSISPSSKTVNSASGTVAITVTATGISSVSYIISGNWISYSSVNGNVYRFSYTANSSSSQRQGTITFYGGGLSETFTLTQSGISSVPITTNTDILRAPNGGTWGSRITVIYDGAFTVSKSSWITGESSGTATGSYEYSWSVPENTGTLREGYIEFTADNSTSYRVRVFQGGTVYNIRPQVIPTSLPFEATGGSQYLVVDFYNQLSYSGLPSWATLNIVEGDLGAYGSPVVFSVTVGSNVSSSSSRSKAVTFTGGDSLTLKTTDVTISQPGGTTPSLSVSPSVDSVGSTGGSVQVTVIATSTITYNISGNWVSFAGKSGNVYTFTYATNTTTSSRTATVTFHSDGLSETYTLMQAAGSSGTLSISPIMDSVSSVGGTVNVTVTATDLDNISYIISSSWLTFVSLTTGRDNVVYTFAYTTNTGSSRTATVIFSSGGLSSTYTLVQAAGQATSLSVSPSTITVSRSSGSTSTTVTATGISSVSYVISGNWLSFAGKSGNLYTFNYTENIGSSSRTATVTFSGGGLTATFAVIQNSAEPVPVSTSSALKAYPPRLRFYKESGRRVVHFSYLPEGGIDSSITYIDGSGWLSITDAGNAKSVVATENTGIRRRATIRFSDHNNSANSVEVRVIQGSAINYYESIWVDTLFYPEDRDADDNYYYSVVNADSDYEYFRGLSTIPAGWGGDVGGIDVPRLVDSYLTTMNFNEYPFTGNGWSELPGYCTVNVNNMTQTGYPGVVDATFKYWNDWSRLSDNRRYDFTRYLNDPINGKGCDNMIIPLCVYYDDAASFNIVETELNGNINTYQMESPSDPFSARYDVFYNTKRLQYMQDNDVIFSYDMTHCGNGALIYRNRFGGWDSFLIEGNIIKTDNFTKQNYRRKGDYNTMYYVNGRHYFEEKFTDSVDINTTYEAHTGWLTDEEAERLAFHLLSSPSVYFQNLNYEMLNTDSYDYFPVRLTASSAEYKKFRNGKKLVKYVITFESGNIKKVRN